MDSLDGFDLDRSVERAWREFRERLADHIAAMVDDEHLTLSTPVDVTPNFGASPYLQFCGFGEVAVRCEVSSNAFLDDKFALSQADEVELVRSGWNPPDPDDAQASPNFFKDLNRDHADQAAAMSVVALRDVFGIAHPAFLEVDARDDDGPLGIYVGHAEAESDPAVDDVPDLVIPADYDHLVELVDQVLTVRFGNPPVKDDDGDIPVRAGSALVFVRVQANAPIIDIFTPLVKGVTNRAKATELLSDLNRDKVFTKFFLNDDYVIAQIQLPAMPFVPEQLDDMLSHLSKVADDIDEPLAQELGGQLPFFQDDDVAERTSTDPRGEEDPLAPELQTLLELDAEGTGSLSASEVATICGHDRDKILALIRTASEQEIEWSKSAEIALSEGDRQEADACVHEGDAWGATVRILRAGLRVVVIGDD